MNFKCMLCNSIKYHTFYTNCPDYFLKKCMSVNYVECDNCSLVQQFPIPNDISVLYDNYPIHIKRSFIQRFARRIFHSQVYFKSDFNIKSNLLDYGCGDGTYLCEVKKNFGTVCGYEPNEIHASNLEVRLGVQVYSSLEKLCAKYTEGFDVITAHFVLEHVLNLHNSFYYISKLLKPGGIFYIAVPNIRSWESILFKKYWHGLDAPRHIVFPELIHFKMLADKYDLNISNVSFASFPNTLAGSLSTIISGSCKQSLLFGFILPAWIISLIVPQGTLIVKFEKKYGRPISRKEVILLSRKIMEQAEKRRIEFSEFEASKGLHVV